MQSTPIPFAAIAALALCAIVAIKAQAEGDLFFADRRAAGGCEASAPYERMARGVDGAGDDRVRRDPPSRLPRTGVSRDLPVAEVPASPRAHRRKAGDAVRRDASGAVGLR